MDLGDSLYQELTQSSNESVRIIAESFKQIWSSSLGADSKSKVENHLRIIDEKDYSMGVLLKYLSTLIEGVNTEGLSDQKITQYLNTTTKVMEAHEAKELVTYLNSIRTFFAHRALYHRRTNRWVVSNDDYNIKYIELSEPIAVLPEEPEPEPEPEVIVEQAPEEVEDPWSDSGDDWGDDDWGDDGWGDDSGDGWGDDSGGDAWGDQSNDSGGFDTPEDEPEAVTAAPTAISEEDLLKVLLEPIIQPVIEGPIIEFSKTDLDLQTIYDSVQISNTKGSLLLLSQEFVGNGGTIKWPEELTNSQDAEITLSEFNFEVKKTSFEAKQVELSYPELLEEKIKGDFEYRSTKARPDGTRSYPRFMSYKNSIELKNTGDSQLKYYGGFTLRGNKLTSESIIGGNSTIEYFGKAGKLYRANSALFQFEDSSVFSDRSDISIYHKYDSIYHPAVRVNYYMDDRELVIRKHTGGFKDTPYESSYLKIDFKADIIRWDVDSDTLDISRLNARDEVPAVFESIDHYNPQDMAYTRAYSDFNPLWAVIHYSRKINSSQFYITEVVDFTKKDLSLVQSGMQILSQAGLITYNPVNGFIKIKRKAFHLSMSAQNRKDYDNLKIFSALHDGPNAQFDIENQAMTINGIDRFYISKILDVYIEPDSNRIVIKGNRDFQFDGHLYAGNFEYVGQDFNFKYGDFLVDLQNIHEINFYILDPDGGGRVKVDNSLSGVAPPDSANLDNFKGSSGTLYINRPNNKSGRRIFPAYPRFDGEGSGSIVYFDKPKYLNGAYDKSFYFSVPPFKLDSLSDSDPSSIGFEGTFFTGGMFPEFEEKLRIRPDLSLGFEHSIPPEGYELFGQDGRIYNKLTLDKNGLRGYGRLDFLTASFESDDFIFYPDSVTTNGSSFEIRMEEYRGVVYPQITGEDYKMLWLTRKDSMYLTSKSSPLQLYSESASLNGTATLTRKGVNGKGILETRGSETSSEYYDFKSSSYTASHAEFKIESGIAEKPALSASDVRLDFNLDNNTAIVSPEIEGAAALEFPFAQFKTSIPEAKWLLDSGKIMMEKPEEINIENSYFYTLREDLDSLSFNATHAVYDINKLELKVSGIPYIIVADAKITPKGGEVLILENSTIGTLKETTIVIDTLNGYHKLYDGTIDVISRNEFSGQATYELVNAVSDTFAIKLTNFRLEDFQVDKRTVEKHTVADGYILADDDLVISAGMFYKGSVKMIANKPALELDGYVKLNLKSIPDYDTWIQYKSSAEQEEVRFNYDESTTEEGRKLSAGIHFDGETDDLYATFIFDKRDQTDQDFFEPSGFLSFKPDSNMYVIVNDAKERGESYEGQMFNYNESNGDISLEGRFNFIDNTKSTYIEASGFGSGNLNSSEFSFNTFMSMGFDLPTSLYDQMGLDFIRIIEELGAPEGLGDRTQLLYKLAEFVGDKDAKEYEQKSTIDYTPLFMVSPTLVKPIVLSDVNLKWSEGQKAFYSEGPIGVSNILRQDVNAAFEGFLEIRKDQENEGFDFFIKAASDSWYYFGYENNKLITFSSNSEYNSIVANKTNAGKAKIGEFTFIPGDVAETLAFINRYRSTYLGIDEPYELDGAVEEIPVEEGFDEEPVDDEGFEDDDDEGF